MFMSYLARSVFCGAAHLIESDVSVLSANSTDAIPTGTEIEQVELSNKSILLRIYIFSWENGLVHKERTCFKLNLSCFTELVVAGRFNLY